MLQLPQQICNSLLDLLHQAHVCLALGSPAARRCLTSTMQKGRIRITSLSPLPILFRTRPGAGGPLGSLLQGCFSACDPPACTGVGVYDFPSAGLCISLSWISRDFSQPISLACQDTTEWWHNHLLYKALHPGSYHLQICTLCHPPHVIKEGVKNPGPVSTSRVYYISLSVNLAQNIIILSVKMWWETLSNVIVLIRYDLP